MDAGVVDDLEAAEQLDLLPAMQALPQRRCHLAQGLSESKGQRENTEISTHCLKEGAWGSALCPNA